jgi:hypothetical protein
VKALNRHRNRQLLEKRGVLPEMLFFNYYLSMQRFTRKSARGGKFQEYFKKILK